MAIIIRTAFNNQDWSGQCGNADRDRRLFQCRESVVNTGYKVTKAGRCTAECWEQSLCSQYSWYSTTGEFGDRAVGRVYFIHRDVDQTLVLWGKSLIKAAEGNELSFKKFKPFPDSKRVRGLTYKDLNEIGVPAWRSGTFRYISDETADALDSLILEFHETLADPAEESWDIEGRKSLRRHVTRERSEKLIKDFKARLTDFTCSVCGFSFETVYGDLGLGFIEAHHTIPIATLTAQTVMSISDLVPVCSNCHRMLHRSNPPLSVKKLQKVVKK
ncbi:MAG: HNH endonuclease [Pseudomonadota bacterium]